MNNEQWVECVDPIYLSGGFTNYLLIRHHFRKDDLWTVGGRRNVLLLSTLSWVAILIVIISCIAVTIQEWADSDSDKPAKW